MQIANLIVSKYSVVNLVVNLGTLHIALHLTIEQCNEQHSMSQWIVSSDKDSINAHNS